MSEREIFRSFLIYGGINEISIAEKPSVAVTIAKVTHARTRKNGYYEGGGYIVSWCVGHLIQMESPIFLVL